MHVRKKPKENDFPRIYSYHTKRPIIFLKESIIVTIIPFSIFNITLSALTESINKNSNFIFVEISEVDTKGGHERLRQSNAK